MNIYGTPIKVSTWSKIKMSIKIWWNNITSYHTIKKRIDHTVILKDDSELEIELELEINDDT